MTTVCPNLLELTEAVREFLEEKVQPNLEGQTAFHARVAVNVLAIIERELRLGPDAREAEQNRLRSLLDRDGDRESLNRDLCRQLLAGEFDYLDPELLNHLRRTTLARLAIDNPRYASYRQAMEKEWKSDELSS